jgi:hypothetical protein
MSKGAVIDESFIQALGLTDHLLTLTRSIENKHHDLLQESLFQISVAEVNETIYMDRQYVFDNQLSIRANYGKDEKILAWLQRVPRVNPLSPKKENVELLMVCDLFLLKDWREFQRFKQFIKSSRILDAQARNYLVEHHKEFPGHVNDPDAIKRILLSLERAIEFSEAPSSSEQAGSLEQVAKTYGPYLAPIRMSPHLPRLLLEREPEVRFNLFRLFCFIEDREKGPETLLQFIVAIAKESRDNDILASVANLGSSRDLQRAFTAIRKFMLAQDPNAKNGTSSVRVTR